MPSAWSIRSTVVVLAGLATLACASAGTNGYREPRMVSRNAPDLRLPTASRNPNPIQLTIEVEVDEAGQADLSTLKLMGAGVSDNRHAIERWLEQARFEPARQGGVAVRGVFKTSIGVTTRTTVRRIRGG